MSGVITELAPWLVGTGLTTGLAARYGVSWRLPVAAVRQDWQTCRSCVQAVRVRHTWPRLAGHLGLTITDKRADKTKTITPRLRIRPDRYGLVVDARTLPRVGLVEWQAAARHLADEWRAVRVAVTQPAPGRVRIRAVRRDPLTDTTTYDPAPESVTAPCNLSSVPLGTDEYAEPVDLRLSGVSGIGVYGLPGYGKTSLINGLITRLSPSPAVQFVIMDGKSDDPCQGDYTGVTSRAAAVVGDDLEQAHDLLTALVDFRRARAASISTLLGVRNVWHRGFSADWPLVLTIIDEAHTYFSQVKDGGDKILKQRNALAAQNAMMVEDLIKKGRSVGMITVVATQKGTGDAIPTQIRDVCAVSIAFACRTAEAAVAALGDDIRQHPDASPVRLQDPAYVGVASMVVPGRPGYTRVRMPYVPDRTTAAVAQLHHGLVLTDGIRPALPRRSAVGIGASTRP